MNSTNLLTQSTKTMKKIKVYGEKNGNIEFIAEVYVKDKEVVVEVENPEIKECMEDMVNLARSLGVGKKTTIPTERGGYKIAIFPLKPGDSDYLDWLRVELDRALTDGKCGEYQFSSKALAGMKVIEE